ncbi:hypothetical protein KHA80_23010 [Anaerobacillus sp. HL2]|nr:hypothetical protein KHA80_23010 [Anaerobacillus sp. HL2]
MVKTTPPMLAAITTAFIMLLLTQTLEKSAIVAAFVYPTVHLPQFI